VEVDDWKRRDNPLIRLRKWMENKGIWDESKDKEARDSTRREVLQEFSKAEKEKKAPLRTMFEDVYEEMTPDIKAQMAQLREHMARYPEEYDVGDYVGGADSLKD
jgi:2-oxoisovalerate dehydrogenase E1 component alpha subunit